MPAKFGRLLLPSAVALALILCGSAKDTNSTNTTSTTSTTTPSCETKPVMRTMDGGLELSVGCGLDIILSENDGATLSLRGQVGTNDKTTRKLGSLQADVDALQDTDNVHAAAIAALQAADTTAATEAIRIDQDLQALGITVSGNQKTADVARQTLGSALSSRIDTAAAELQTSIDDIQAAVTATEQRLLGSVAGVQAGVDKNIKDIATVQAGVGTTATDLRASIATVAATADQNSLDIAKGQSNLATNVATLQGSIAGVKSTVDKNAKGIADLVTAIAPKGKKCPNPITATTAGLSVKATEADLNNLWPGAQIQASCPSVCHNNARVWAKYYMNLGGTAVANLVNTGNFQTNSYNIIDATTSTTSRFQSRVDFAENYGGVVKGYFKAPITGSYQFFLRSDDSSILEISTAPWPAHQMTRVVTLDGCCREEPGSTISLQAGKYYLMRGIYKEGGGGDYLFAGISWSGHDRMTTGAAGELSEYFECPQVPKTTTAFCQSDGVWSVAISNCEKPYVSSGLSINVMFP